MGHDNNGNMELIIITGISGAGKTVAIQSLEDLGYLCMDNVLPTLIPQTVELLRQSRNSPGKLAIVVDIRGGEFFEQTAATIDQFSNLDDFQHKVVFLEANNKTLVQRYKATRRSHPLSEGESPLKGIEKERELLQELKSKADYIIDTSELSAREFKGELINKFSKDSSTEFSVNIISFGFKYGTPIDADVMFDVRFLDNPFYVPELKPQTGLDKPVSEYVLSKSKTQEFLSMLKEMLDFLLPNYKKEGKSQVVIAIGCTGGKHRSVTLTEELYATYKDKYNAHVTHRDITKNKELYITQ